MAGNIKRKSAMLIAFLMMLLYVSPVHAADEVDISTYIELPMYYLESLDYLHRRIYSQSVTDISGTKALKYVTNAYGINQYYGSIDMIFEVRAAQKIDKTKLHRTALYVQCMDMFGNTYGGKSTNEITAVTYPDDKTVRFHVQNQVDHLLVSEFPFIKLDYQQKTLNAGEGYEFHIYFKGVNADGVVIDSSSGGGGSGGDPDSGGECCNDLKELLSLISTKLDTIVSAIGKIGSFDSGAITGNADKNAQDIQNNANQNAEDIKNNANQNSQDIQDNADKNTNIIEEKLEETKKGIISGFIDGLKGLFIPSDEFFKAWFDDMYAFFNDRFGFLMLPVDLLVQLVDIISTSGTADAGIPFPQIAWEGTVLIPAQTVTFDIFNTEFGQDIQKKLYFVGNVIMIGALIMLMHNKFEEVLRS